MRILLFYDNFIRDYVGLLLLSEILKKYGHKVFIKPLWDHAINKINKLDPDIVVMGQIGEYSTCKIGDYVKLKQINLVLNSTESVGTNESMENFYKRNFKESNEKFIDFQVIVNRREYNYILNNKDFTEKEKYKWIGFPRYDFHLNESLKNVEKTLMEKKYNLNQYNLKYSYISSFIYDGSGEQVSPENLDSKDQPFREKLDILERRFTEEILFKLVETFNDTNDVLMIKKHPWEKCQTWEEKIKGNKNIIILENTERINSVLSVTDYMMHLRSTTAIDAWCWGVKTISLFPNNEQSNKFYFDHLKYEVIVSDFCDLLKVIDNYPDPIPGLKYLEKYYKPFLDDKATIRLAKEINKLKPKAEKILISTTVSTKKEINKLQPTKRNRTLLLNKIKGTIRQAISNVKRVLNTQKFDLSNINKNSYQYNFMLWETKKKEVERLYKPVIKRYIKENIDEVLN